MTVDPDKLGGGDYDENAGKPGENDYRAAYEIALIPVESEDETPDAADAAWSDDMSVKITESGLYVVAVRSGSQISFTTPITVTMTEEKKDPTCEEDGSDGYRVTAEYENAVSTDSATVTIPALGHDWGEATYVWAEDNSSVTANRVCARVESHVATETAKATSKVTKEATCEAPGETTYTAAFENAAFETQTKTEKNIPAKGHAWGKPAWSWTEDNKASAAFTCANDAEHVKTVEAEVEEVRKAATCTEDGSATYTAKVTFEGKEYTDTQVKTLTATGHSWGKATYVWAEDNGSVTAKRVCANDETHIETETAKATAEITKGADCEESGEITYTAVFENAAFEKQTKTEATSPMGHAWGDWKTVKEPTADADGEEQRVCDRCGAEQTRALPYGGHVCPSAHFTDTDLGLWYHEDLDYVVENGLMIGMSADEFGPDLVMTRAMVVTALYRLEGEPTPKSSVSAFGDVVRGSWYAAAVNWAAENGIVKGMSAEEFMPNDSITREQMATIFYRYAKYKGYNVAASDGLNKFTDAGKVSGWALEAMQWCVGAGLINGMSKTELSPRGTATRIQYAAILHASRARSLPSTAR